MLFDTIHKRMYTRNQPEKAQQQQQEKGKINENRMQKTVRRSNVKNGKSMRPSELRDMRADCLILFLFFENQEIIVSRKKCLHFTIILNDQN